MKSFLKRISKALWRWIRLIINDTDDIIIVISDEISNHSTKCAQLIDKINVNRALNLKLPIDMLFDDKEWTFVNVLFLGVNEDLIKEYEFLKTDVIPVPKCLIESLKQAHDNCLVFYSSKISGVSTKCTVVLYRKESTNEN